MFSLPIYPSASERHISGAVSEDRHETARLIRFSEGSRVQNKSAQGLGCAGFRDKDGRCWWKVNVEIPAA